MCFLSVCLIVCMYGCLFVRLSTSQSNRPRFSLRMIINNENYYYAKSVGAQFSPNTKTNEGIGAILR